MNHEGQEDDFAAGLSQLLHRDYKSAARHLQRAFARGNTDAAFYLGMMNYEGTGIPLNRIQGRRFVELAAEAGNREAMDQLAIWHLNGDIGPKNLTKAFQYTRSAAEAGSIEAGLRLGYMYFWGIGVKRNLPQAMCWARKPGLRHPFPWHNLNSVSQREMKHEVRRITLTFRVAAITVCLWLRDRFRP